MLSSLRSSSYDTMRGYGSIHANNYSNGSNGDAQQNYSNSSGFPGDAQGRGLERRPSKLDQMRADYQKKMLKEKEEKLVNMYEENQRKAMGRINARNGSGGYVNGGAKNNNHGNNNGQSVREFFNERRRLEQTGAPVPPIDNHYRQTKGYSSPGAFSNRTGSGNSSTMSSAGRDRAQPLAPIKRPSDSAVNGHQVNGGNHLTNGNAATANGNNSGRSGIPQRHSANNGVNNTATEDNPFKGRPVFVKHKPLPPTSRKGSNYNDDNSNHIAPPPSQYNKQSGLPKNGRKPPISHRKYQPPAQQQRQVPQRRQISHRQPQPESSSSGGQQKMTDFQKWQLEQNQARENRLKKLNSKAEEQDDDEEGGYWGHTSESDPIQSGTKTNHAQVTPSTSGSRSIDNVELASDCEEEGVDEDEGEGEVARLERELLEKIGREQAELERIKEERKKAEDEEKRELELKKKREAAERARIKKEQEEQRKEEERRRREEAEEEKRERQRAEKEEEKRRKEDEKRRKEEEKVNAKRQKEEEKRRKEELKQEQKWQREEEKRRKEEEKSAYSSSRKGDYYGEDEWTDEEELPPSRGDSYTVSKNPSSTSRNMSSQRQETEESIDERPVDGGGVSGADYYAQMANSSEAKGSVGSLVSCKVCGRKFAADRLRKHQNACTVVSKPRKEFNSKLKRVEGTDMAKYQGKHKKDPPKKKSTWRHQHTQFIESLRYAKKAAEYEKQGKDVRELGPPPAAPNPDLVPCPHCGRKFNEMAAERHIPRCKDLKTKPARMRR